MSRTVVPSEEGECRWCERVVIRIKTAADYGPWRTLGDLEEVCMKSPDGRHNPW